MKKKNPRKNSFYFWIFINIALLIISIMLIFVIYFLITKNNNNINNKNKNKNISNINNNQNNLNENKVRRLIDGVFIENGKENLYPTAIMIDNHIDARPSFGLSKANFVFEAEAEGGITRYLAIFANDENIEKIGPIRSARPYFVNWAKEFSAVYTHCGGSPDALAMIIKGNIIDLNEFYNEDYFWRDKIKQAPHNIYISSEKLNNFKNKKKLENGKFFSWKYKNDSKIKNRPDKASISINFELDDYKVKWKYDKNNNNYIRYLAKNIHKDSNGDIIIAKNIVIMFIDSKVIDDKMRLDMNVVGSGKAIVCFDGICNDAEWNKKSESSRTRFYKENNEIEFNAGTTWIEVVNPKTEIMIK